MTDQELLDRITANPQIMTGKPVIKGTRLTVEFVLERLAHGATPADIVQEYEGVTTEDVLACLLYAKTSLKP